MDKKIKYYSLKKIKELHAQYNMIIGERSNGKTYSVLKEILEQYFLNRSQGAIVRRWQDDFKGKRALAMFAPLVADNLVFKLSKGQWDRIDYRSGCWYPARYDEDTELLSGVMIRSVMPLPYPLWNMTSQHHIPGSGSYVLMSS